MAVGVGLVLVALALVALATWVFLSRAKPASQADDIIPPNSVSLINSRTPIPERDSPLIARDVITGLVYAPEYLEWSPELREADRARQDGRYSSAISQYSALVNHPDRQTSHNALWGLAASYADDGQDTLAIRTYSLFTYLRDDPRASRAFFHIAQLHERNARRADAARLYDEYIGKAGPARNAARVLIGKLLWSGEDAEDNLRNVIDGNALPGDRRPAIFALADLYSREAEREKAIELYDTLAKERKENPLPLIDHTGEPPEVLAAEQVRLVGDSDEMRTRLIDYLNSGSGYEYGLYSALTALLTITPSAVVSGVVPPLRASEITYDAGAYHEAIGHLNTLRAAEPQSPQLARAAFMTGRSFGLLGDVISAYNWYTNTVQSYPDSPEAPEAARRAGDALEQQAAWEAALSTYMEAASRYPDTEQAAIARLRGGVLAYRLEQRDAALGLLSPVSQSETISPALRAGATFWVGKIEKNTGNAAWRDTLEQVPSLAPGSYEAFRALSLVGGEPDSGPTVPSFEQSALTAAELSLDFNAEEDERRELIEWASRLPVTRTATTAATRTPQVAGPDADRVEETLAQDPEVQRAAALLRLNYTREAFPAFRAVAERLQKEGDAVGLAQIVIYLRYHADPRTAMTIAEHLAAMDVGGNPLQWPKLLLKTLYPTPYAELVVDESKQRGIDPLVMYALMRQESQFVAAARSHADARGLTQVIPSTGGGIAEQLGDADFDASDLYLPHVSIRYGTYYLASNLPQFDGKLLPTLAAYNGGPGNAARWMDGSALIDPDLYRERIDLFETGDYLERVYTNYGFYRFLYGR
jgi:soluble lytic murein transglycosylase